MMLQKYIAKPINLSYREERPYYSCHRLPLLKRLLPKKVYRFARNMSTALQQICDRKSPNGYGRSINTLIYSEHVMTCFNFLIVTAQEPDSICLW